MNSNPRTFNSARNLTMSVFQKLISIVLTFVGRQIFLQVLSVEYLGISSLFRDIISVLSLADLGMATAMAYSFYKPIAEKDEDKLAALIGYYRRFYNVLAAAVALIGIALIPLLKYIIKLENDIPYIEVYYLITLSHTVVSYLFVYKATIIRADQNSRMVTKYTMWTSVIVMAIQVPILLIFKNYMLYCLVPVFGTLANNLIISHRADTLYPFIKKKAVLASEERKSIFNNMRSMFVYKIAGVIYSSTDSILISTIIGTAIVGKYSNYRLAVTNLSALAFMIFTSLVPSIGNLIVKEPPEKRLEVFRVMQTISCWLGGFFVFCLFFLLDEFVILWLGQDFVFGLPLKLAVLAEFYLQIALNPLIAFREGTGIYQKTKFVMLAGAALNLILSIILGTFYGLPGIIFATIISKLLTFAWYEPIVLFRDYLGGHATSYLRGHIINLILLISCIVVAQFFFPWKGSASWLEWILKGVVYTISINIVYFLRYFRTPEFQEIISKVKGLLKKRS